MFSCEKRLSSGCLRAKRREWFFNADIRRAEKVVGKSINLALSHRGRTALRAVGLEKHIVAEGIPMRARMIHSLDETTHPVPYGTREDHFIISIDRRRLNEVMLTLAESQPNVTLHFGHKLVRCNLHTGRMLFQLSDNINERVEKFADSIIGCDGAHSAVRDAMLKQAGFQYQQEYIEHGYIELVTPPTKNGEYAMPPNYLHIWPRMTFMLIALPNLDKSFTTTLFMPFDKFSQLRSPETVVDFFRTTFPDALNLIGEESLVKDFLGTKPSSLISVKCKPYHFGKAIIIGDAAHAMVPFYGQGMNAGFLDCLRLDELLEEYNGNFERVYPEFTRRMQINSHAIIDLAMYNYIEMRYLVNTRSFLIRKKVDNFLYRLFPNTWIPLYTMVTFSLLPYSECMKRKKWQDTVLRRGVRIGIAMVVLLAYYRFGPRPPVRMYINAFKSAVKDWFYELRVRRFELNRNELIGMP
ncbi:kynurenine 3-monooxygenase-like isoform X2 [Paramacrobiotus metropolitanus]|uniref:kynurenine 3-monooxygenase-like isoform X2 n=1 Tax=Paramacrobiotus metropolitanus TaxID=2943436 RepID=UPI00244595C8|nr:kynurenine 3-monooxygenase-like isoform X2 [Paramacrobiotus metropolitanus]